MANHNRPISPHLDVYRFQINMATSIAHRITGFGLALGALALTWWLLAILGGQNSYATFYGFFKSIFGQLMLFGWLWAFVYHVLNGVRHLVWDTGRGITVEQGRRTGWLIAFASVIVSAVLWFFMTGFSL